MYKLSERVSVTQAAKELGIAPQGVREYMKRNLIDIGSVMPSVTGKGLRYLIFRDKLNRYIGRELPRENEKGDNNTEK